MEAIGSTDEGVAVLHAKALLEHCAITVRVNLKFHGNRDVVVNLDFLERLICDDTLTIPHENSLVLGCLD